MFGELCEREQPEVSARVLSSHGYSRLPIARTFNLSGVEKLARRKAGAGVGGRPCCIKEQIII